MTFRDFQDIQYFLLHNIQDDRECWKVNIKLKKIVLSSLIERSEVQVLIGLFCKYRDRSSTIDCLVLLGGAKKKEGFLV